MNSEGSGQEPRDREPGFLDGGGSTPLPDRPLGFEIARKPVVYLPHNQALETFCPECKSLGTEWHPAERWGLCHSCGAQWKTIPVERAGNLAVLDSLPTGTADLIRHIYNVHQPAIIARIAYLAHRGEPIPFDEISQWHRMLHQGYRVASGGHVGNAGPPQ